MLTQDNHSSGPRPDLLTRRAHVAARWLLVGCAAVAATLATACDFKTQPFDDDQAEAGAGGAGAGSEQGGASSGGGGAGAGGGATPMGPEGPMVTIRMRATTEPFEHQDELSGQTPSLHRSGIRKLVLYRDAADPAPVTLFDLGEDSVEVGYDDGDDSFIYAIAASSLPLGTFTIARAVHSYVRYRVDSTMHAAGNAMAGEFDCMQVLSDGTLVDGQLRNHGYYEYVFTTAGQSFPTSGANAPLPASPETGGFSASLEDGAWTYTYAVELPITPQLTADLTVVLNVNMHESFRWEDQPLTGYAPGVFDTTPIAFEPVVTFGANDYWMTLE